MNGNLLFVLNSILLGVGLAIIKSKQLLALADRIRETLD